MNSPDFSLFSKKALIVEESPDIQLLIKVILERQGMRVQFATSGEECLCLLEKDDFDIVLMDARLKAVTGTNLLDTMRKSGHRIPVVALTTQSTKNDLKREGPYDYDDFVLTPIQKGSLLEVVSRRLLS